MYTINKIYEEDISDNIALINVHVDELNYSFTVATDIDEFELLGFASETRFKLADDDRFDEYVLVDGEYVDYKFDYVNYIAIKPGVKSKFLSNYYSNYDAYNLWWENEGQKDFKKKLIDLFL